MEINVQMIGNAMAWEHALQMDGVKELLDNLKILYNALVIDYYININITNIIFIFYLNL